MFFMVTLFSIPIYAIYSGNTVNMLSGLDKLSLGNLGGSDIIKSNFQVSKIKTLGCRKGLVMLNDSNYLNGDKFYDFGLVNK